MNMTGTSLPMVKSHSPAGGEGEQSRQVMVSCNDADSVSEQQLMQEYGK